MQLGAALAQLRAQARLVADGAQSDDARGGRQRLVFLLLRHGLRWLEMLPRRQGLRLL